MAARWGEVTEVSNDKGPYKLLRVKSDGHEITAHVLEPYGVQSAPIKGGQVILIPIDGDEGKCIAICMPSPEKRYDAQKEGEASFINHLTGNRLKHLENGDTELKTKGVFYVNSDN